MKKFNFLAIFLLIITTACNVQASLPVEYWKNEPTTYIKYPSQSIKPASTLQARCNQTIAAIKARKTINLTTVIPRLMDAFTQEMHTMPDKIIIPEIYPKVMVSILSCAHAFNDYITKPVDSGPHYEVFKHIIEKDPILKKRNPSFNTTSGWIGDILFWYNGAGGCSTNSKVIFPSNNNPDAWYLFAINHELQHQRNGMNSTRWQIASLHSNNALIDLKKTLRVQSILKSKIKNNQGTNIETILQANGDEVQKEIIRYEEYRADTQAIKAMQCPLCVQEASIDHPENQGYNPKGYLYQWQFQPRIDQLKAQRTICQHHHENGEIIDTSITDGSTLAKRLNIIQKK